MNREKAEGYALALCAFAGGSLSLLVGFHVVGFVCFAFAGYQAAVTHYTK